MDKRVKGGRLYLKKGTIVDVKTPTGELHPAGWRVQARRAAGRLLPRTAWFLGASLARAVATSRLLQ